MAEYNKSKQTSMRKPSMTEIIKIFGQVKEIMDANQIEGSYEGVKKAMELGGVSMAQLKEFRGQANFYINNPIAKQLIKSQGVDINKFLDMVDNFIAQNDNVVTTYNGNRAFRRQEQKVDKQYNKTKSWRDR